MTKRDLKDDLKAACENARSFDAMLDDIVDHVAENFKVKKVVVVRNGQPKRKKQLMRQ